MDGDGPAICLRVFHVPSPFLNVENLFLCRQGCTILSTNSLFLPGDPG